MTTISTANPEVALALLLDRLNGVVQVVDGFKATCPAHDDRRPSLSIKEGDRGLLLKCWTGCSLADICRAIGLNESDLFYDPPYSKSYKSKGTPHERANLYFKWDWRRQTGEILAITNAREVLAQEFLKNVQAVDPATLTDFHREAIMEKISLASKWIELAESAAELCFEIANRQHRNKAANA